MGPTLLRSSIFAAVALASALGTNVAQAGTCSFNAGTQTMTVTISGVSTLSVISAGNIQLDRINCGSASVRNTQFINVTGSANADTLNINTSNGGFKPGTLAASGEGDVAEIKFTVNLAGGRDSLFIIGAADNDNFVIGASGINLDGDGDSDITYSNIEVLELDGNAGNDFLSAQGGYGTGAQSTLGVTLNGGPDDDILLGGAGADSLYGYGGNDTLYGYGGNDTLNGGVGDDYLDGGDGNDTFNMGAVFDGNDILVGGAGRDAVSYGTRAAAVSVFMDGSCFSGDVFGEQDCVGADIEIAYGGAGDDYIQGNALANDLYGNAGADWIEGGGANDNIYGGDGDDILMGGDGNDYVNGQNGNDCVDGNAGDDNLLGGEGNDMIDGGTGRNTVSGGNGIDDCMSVASGSGGDCETRS